MLNQILKLAIPDEDIALEHSVATDLAKEVIGWDEADEFQPRVLTENEWTDLLRAAGELDADRRKEAEARGQLGGLATRGFTPEGRPLPR